MPAIDSPTSRTTATSSTSVMTTVASPFDTCCIAEQFRNGRQPNISTIQEFGSGEFSYDNLTDTTSPLDTEPAPEQQDGDRTVATKTINSTNSSSYRSVGLNTNFNGPSNRRARSQQQEQPVRYSVTELVKTLGHEKDASTLPPELTRRILDFRMATIKRREKYGEESRWGLYGLYSHLSNVRTDLEWAEDAAWRRRHGRPYLSWTDFDAQRKMGNLNRPWFTYFLIVVCTIMLIVEFALNDWKVEPINVNPMVGPSAQALINSGARVTQLIVVQGQWFRILSPLFLHAGIIHYVVNMLALWFIGAAVERNHGILNTMILFFIPGIGGCILSALFLPHFISVGASGGIFGLVGGCTADIALNWNLLFLKTGADDSHIKRQMFTAFAMLMLDIVINIIFGLTPYVDNFSHLGGLFYGVCCGLSTIDPIAVGFFGVHMTTIEKIRATIRRFLGLIVSVILIIVTSSLLATMDLAASPCPNCRYISCVPFPFWTEHKWWYCDDCDYVTATLYLKNDEYDWVDLTCPDGEHENVPVQGMFVDQTALQKGLPSLCRQFCPNTI